MRLERVMEVIMKHIALVLSVFLTSSCALSLAREPVSIKQLLPVGSILHLTRPLEIPVGKAYVYIAHGEVVPFKPYNTVNIYKPYCKIHLHKVSQQARKVEPDRFRVTRVVEWEDYYGQSSAIRYASLDLSELRIHGGLGIGLGMMEDASPSTVMYATIISLQSEKQPQVEELVCGHWDTLGVVEPLTLEEMKSALGDLILVEPPGPDGQQ